MSYLDKVIYRNGKDLSWIGKAYCHSQSEIYEHKFGYNKKMFTLSLSLSLS